VVETDFEQKGFSVGKLPPSAALEVEGLKEPDFASDMSLGLKAEVPAAVDSYFDSAEETYFALQDQVQGKAADGPGTSLKPECHGPGAVLFD
jgi:hypothetical protein